MKIKNTPVVVYDIEVFPNVFHCTCKDTETNEFHFFEISIRRNQIKELKNYFLDKTHMFCGYNNHHYDDVIINYIIDYYDIMINKHYVDVCKSIYNLSDAIIKAQEGETKKFNRWKYANFFYSMDILTMMFSSKLRVGLKAMQMTMRYHNVQEYDGDFTQWLPKEEIDKMKEYNINDVESTAVLLEKKKKDIEVRLFIEQEYGIDALSMDSVKFGTEILAKEYCRRTGISKWELKQMRSPQNTIALKDVILPIIDYKDPILKAVLKDMKSSVVSSLERKGYEKKFVLSDVCYSVGVGGIHSINSPEIYKPKSDEYIGHSDVTSMYPSFIVQYKWGPQHLGLVFWEIYKDVYYQRIEAKHSGQKNKNQALKLTLNSVSGKMQEETSWMYDPLNVFKIRINGQLVLLMLVDRLLELGCKIVQVNTDGVYYIAKKTVRDRVQEAIHEIEQLTKLEFESDNYEAFYQYAVNDYFGVVEGYSQSHDPELIQKVGSFRDETEAGKGLTPVIIPKAVMNYFLTNEPVENYIKRQTDIYDFLMGQRVDKKFKVRHGDKYVQHLNRYYASTNDYYLFKVDDNGKETNMLTKSGVTILNKVTDSTTENKHVNYRYYISEAYAMIEKLRSVQLSLFQ